MPFTVKDFHDLVRLLEEHPQWRAELRKLLLSEELLELPLLVKELVEAQTHSQHRLEELRAQTEQRFQVVAEQIEALTRRLGEFEIRTEQRFQAVAEQIEALTRRLEEFEIRTEQRFQVVAEQIEALTRRVDTLAEQMEILTRRVDTLAEQMEILTRRVDALAEQVNTLVGQVVNLAMRIDALGQQLIQLIDWQRGEDGRRRGERYERDIVRRAVTIFAGGAGGTAEDFHVQEKLSKWIRAITGGERFLEPEDDPALSDLIWWKGEKVLVVEVSLRVDGYDVTRAHKRAQTLRSIGVDAAPVVIGVEWANDEAQEAAERKGVWWYVNEMPSEELIEFRLMEG